MLVALAGGPCTLGRRDSGTGEKLEELQKGTRASNCHFPIFTPSVQSYLPLLSVVPEPLRLDLLIN